MQDSDWVLVGVIHGAHGVRGLLKVESLSDNPARFAAGSRLHACIHSAAPSVRRFTPDSSPRGGALARGQSPDNNPRQLTVISATPHKSRLLIAFEGVASREQAEALLGAQLMAEPDAALLPEGQYYHYQLAGLAVYERGEYIGKITDILSRPANDVYVIQNEAGEEIWIPALKSVVKKVDLEAGRMEVELPIND